MRSECGAWRATLLALLTGATALKAQQPRPIDSRAGLRGSKSVIVRVDDGPIEGVRLEHPPDLVEQSAAPKPAEREVMCFKGVPFARPPVGSLRWRPPQRPEPWTQPRPCLSFSAACPQPRSIAFDTPLRMSEDCLYLNVWAPATKTPSESPFPVMVWIHGGSHVNGAGSSLAYDGHRFACRGIVLVTINYRLGPFGYLAHPLLSAESPNHVSGNYGELDMIAALDWVRRNIAAFGGDPRCVTIFGESAGAASVARLMTSPLAKGLFHRAICQSGGPFGNNRRLRDRSGLFEPAETQGERIAQKLGCEKEADVLSAMRSKTADEILRAANPSQGLFGKGEKFGPIVDGYVLPEDPARVFLEGRQEPVPLLAGSNADEGSIFLIQQPVQRLAGYRILLRAYFGDAERALRLFPCNDESQLPQAMNRVITVASFAAPARAMVESAARINAPAYLYQFTRVPNTERARKDGCFHALEILYVFGTNARLRGFDEDDRRISRMMTDYWANFARAGDPNGQSLPHWPSWTAASDAHMELDLHPAAKSGLFREEIELVMANYRRRIP